MSDGQARIIVGASPVAADRRHTYLIFEHSDGTQQVVRGGPDDRTEGNDLANFAESTLLGADRFGHIRVDSAPYIPPYEAVYSQAPDGSITPRPASQADLDDPALIRDTQGQPVRDMVYAPDWPGPGEQHERLTVWTGSDSELEGKLDTALKAGQQINDAKLEYSPLSNNSNGVTSNLLKAADVAPALPKDKEGEDVRAPNFGEDLYKDVGLASFRSGYRFDGKQWYDERDQKIQPPKSGEAVVPMGPGEPHQGSFHSSSSQQHAGPIHEQADMRDARHPAHAMYLQAYDGVAAIDRALGRAPDEYSERLAAAIAAQSRADGLQNIAKVVMNDDRSRAFAVDSADASNPWRKHSSVDVGQGVSQPVEASTRRSESIEAQRAQHAGQQAWANTNDAPPIGGLRHA